MRHLGYAVIVLATLAVASTNAFAMRKATFMTEAMNKFVGQPDTLLIDKMGRPSESKIIDGTTVDTWAGYGCRLEVDIENHIIKRWVIRGSWSGCWPSFERLYQERWLNQ
jgi:hypothetical protein